MNKAILVVVAHPDDEVLGCGGTIARNVAEGNTVHVVFMANGVDSRQRKDNLDKKTREKARNKALNILGVSKYYTLNFPDNRMDSVPLLDIIQKLEKIIDKLNPNQVFTHHHGDLNIDHRITHQAVMTACRPIPGKGINEIFSFEVMSSTEWAGQSFSSFIPNMFIDITQFIEIKIKALEAYKIEMRPHPHSRSIKHLEVLAKHRGNCVGLEFAEAFEIQRAWK